MEEADNATVILGDESEPQPDLHLRLLPECGGRSRVNADDYFVGPPELVIEVAHSSEAIDLDAKRRDYERAGVLEYLVLCVREGELRPFDLKAGRALAVGAGRRLPVKGLPRPVDRRRRRPGRQHGPAARRSATGHGHAATRGVRQAVGEETRGVGAAPRRERGHDEAARRAAKRGG